MRAYVKTRGRQRGGNGRGQVQVGLSMIDNDLVEVKQDEIRMPWLSREATYLYTMPAPVAASKISNY